MFGEGRLPRENVFFVVGMGGNFLKVAFYVGKTILPGPGFSVDYSRKN